MVSPVATPVPQPHACAQHQYGTRIRSNSVIRPSARLRQSPDFPAPPRRIRPVPTSKSKSVAVIADAPKPDISPFPPEHVMLHSEDVNSKVFLAIGRSFMSVVRPPRSILLLWHSGTEVLHATIGQSRDDHQGSCRDDYEVRFNVPEVCPTINHS